MNNELIKNDNEYLFHYVNPELNSALEKKFTTYPGLFKCFLFWRYLYPQDFKFAGPGIIDHVCHSQPGRLRASAKSPCAS